MYRIFAVEDDAVIASAVQRHLESWGYQVACAVRFDDVLSDFAAFDPQLVLLDISLPFFNGYHWCREIRKVSNVPILFLTSASDDMNLVMAMEMGGDDLLAKPFDLQVLSAKVQALLRRAHIASEQQILVGNTRLDSASYTVTCRGQTLELPKKEFDLLYKLLSYPGQIFTRSQLLDDVWGYVSESGEDTVKTHISRLRNRLKDVDDFQIITIKGLGYKAELVKEKEQ